MQEMESKLTVLHASKYFDVVGTMHLFSDELAVARAAANSGESFWAKLLANLVPLALCC